MFKTASTRVSFEILRGDSFVCIGNIFKKRPLFLMKVLFSVKIICSLLNEYSVNVILTISMLVPELRRHVALLFTSRPSPVSIAE